MNLKEGTGAIDDNDLVEELEALKDDKKLTKAKDDLKRLQTLQRKRETGTRVTFLPDIDVFKGEKGTPDITFDPSRLKGRMNEIAYLNAGLVLALKDKRMAKPKTEVFYHAGGLTEYAQELCKTKVPLFQPPKKNKRVSIS